MRFRHGRIAAFAAAALVLAACGGDETAESTTSDEPTSSEEPTQSDEPTDETSDMASEEPSDEPVTRADADLVIWADDTRAPVIEPFAEDFGAAEGITVAVQEVEFDQIRDLMSTQAPAGEGPDVFIGAHDWLGQLVSDGVVAPLDIANSDDFFPVATAAFNFEGNTYGLPYAIENIALVRNVDLVPQRPETVEEMAEVALALLDAGEVTVPLAWQQPDVYHAYWLVTGAGGYVFGTNDDGSYDPTDLGIDSEGGLEAGAIFADLVERGAISGDVTYDIMRDSFAAGDAPFAVTGPWAVADFGDVNYVVEPLPSVAGGEARPFVGVQGFMVSSFAANELAAKTFVLDYMATQDAQLQLFEAGNRPPALQAAFDAISDNPVVAGFGAAGANGYAMPSIPEMGSVWSAWADAYTLILDGGDPTEAFTAAATQIRNLIAGG